MVVTTRNVSGLLNFNTMQGGRDGGAILFIFGSGGSCDNLIILKAKKGGEKSVFLLVQNALAPLE